MPDLSYPSIPDPTSDPSALLNTVKRLKEAVELMTGQTLGKGNAKDFSFPNRVSVVERRSATAAARFTESLQIQATDLDAVVIRTTTLEADMGDANAAITAEQIARVDADDAFALNIVTVEASVDDAFAAVNSESLARADADSAMALDIVDVTATANGATANGQIYLRAEVAPGGYSAQYGWQLNAGQSIGMKALVDGTTGEGSIAFFADKFSLVDPSYLGGAPARVFDYNGVTFNFDVPVTIRNQEIGANAVSNTVATAGFAGPGVLLTTATLDVRAGARVLVEVKLTDTSASIYLAPFSTAFISRILPVYADASLIGNLTTMDTIVSSNFLGGSAYAFYKGFTPASVLFIVTGLSAGTHTFAVQNNEAVTLGLSISATELSR